MTMQTAKHSVQAIRLPADPLGLNAPERYQITDSGWWLFENNGLVGVDIMMERHPGDAPLYIAPGGWRLHWFDDLENLFFYGGPGHLAIECVVSYWGQHKPDLSNGGLGNIGTPGSPASEANPLFTSPEETLTKEAIKYIKVTPYDYPAHPIYYLTQSQIDSLFDKDCDTGITFQDGDLYEVKLKMPIRVKELLLSGEDNVCWYAYWRYIDFEGVAHPADVEQEPQYTYASHIFVDDQIGLIQFYISNPI